MSLRRACTRCASACFERNPAIARMLGLCPLLAVTDSFFDGLVFGGFFAMVLCVSSLCVSVTRNLVIRPLRPLYLQLVAAVAVAGLGAGALILFHATMASYALYLALVAANCLLLDYLHEHAHGASPAELLRELPLTAGAVWTGVIAFGTLRGLLAGPFTGAGGESVAGPMPVAGAPAGALILLGLVAAGANALRQRSAAAAPAVAESRAGA